MIIDKFFKKLEKIKSPVHNDFKKDIKDYQIIKVQNIADYYGQAKFDEYWDVEESFPNVAPPWEKFWMEWSSKNPVDESVNHDHGLMVSVLDFKKIGDKDLESKISKASELINSPYEFSKEDIRSEFRWGFSVMWFCSVLGGNPIKLNAGFMVKEDGSATFIKNGNSDRFLQCVLPEHIDPKLEESITSLFVLIPLRILLLSLCFSNCKNVSKEVVGFGKNLKSSRASKNKPPISKYYTLEIGQIKKSINKSMESGSGIKKALHICRGHFKNYKEGKGLFGKHHGIYWTPMHTKGSVEEGNIVKDYSINV